MVTRSELVEEFGNNTGTSESGKQSKSSQVIQKTLESKVICNHFIKCILNRVASSINSLEKAGIGGSRTANISVINRRACSPAVIGSAIHRTKTRQYLRDGPKVAPCQFSEGLST